MLLGIVITACVLIAAVAGLHWLVSRALGGEHETTINPLLDRVGRIRTRGSMGGDGDWGLFGGDGDGGDGGD